MTFDLREPGGEIASVVLKWKLPREKAEAFRNELTAHKTNLLYAVVDGELAFDDVDRVAMQNDKLMKQNTYVALTAERIDLYFDAALTEEAGVFRIE